MLGVGSNVVENLSWPLCFLTFVFFKMVCYELW